MRGDRSAVWAASSTALFLVLLQLVTKAARDALFLSHVAIDRLPEVMIAAAVSSFAVAMGASFLLARVGPLRLLSALTVTNAVIFAVEWWLAARAPSAVAVAVYLHLASLGSLTISTFWSLVNERFDPHRARRIVGRVNGGATLGGVLGGVLALLAGPQLEVADLLLFSAGASVVAWIGARLLGGQPRAPDVVAVPEGLAVLVRETPYLGLVAVLAALIAVGSALADFTLKARASELVSTGAPLVAFFALFYSATALATFVVQATVTRRLLTKLGLGPALGALPSGYALAGLGAGVFGGLPAAVVFSGTDQVLGNSLHRSGYELLYTPVAPEKKRRLKLVLDVGVARVGDAMGGAIVLVMLWISPALAARIPLVGLVTAGLALLVVRRLERGYVEALAASLRARTVSLGDSDLDLLDATTKATLHSTVTMDRLALLREIDALHPVARDHGARDQLGALLSADPAVVRAALAASDLDPRLLSFCLSRAHDPEIADALASAVLARGSTVVGAVCDAIADDALALAPRARLVRLLGQVGGRRAARALVEVIEAGHPELTGAAAEAFARLAAADPTLAPERSRVLSWAVAALDRAPTGEGRMADDGRRRVMESVFRLFALTFDAQLIAAAERALASDDVALRGTALELLENILPEAARAAIRRDGRR